MSDPCEPEAAVEDCVAVANKRLKGMVWACVESAAPDESRYHLASLAYRALRPFNLPIL